MGSRNSTAGKKAHDAEQKMVDMVRSKELLAEVLSYIDSHRGSVASLKKKLNNASWNIKKALLIEAIQLGEGSKMNDLASEILKITEPKKATVKGEFEINKFGEEVVMLLDDLEDVDHEKLFERAEEIRQSRIEAHRNKASERASEEV